MDSVEQNLDQWRESLVSSIPIGGLLSRNAIAYKWKAPDRCWLLREAAFWRVTDLLTQSLSLHKQEHGLGARILLRSCFETLATLIYLNHRMRLVLDGTLNFHSFDRDTIALVLGSRDGSTGHTAVNVLKMLDKADKRYPAYAPAMTICRKAPTRTLRAWCRDILRSITMNTKPTSPTDGRRSMAAPTWNIWSCACSPSTTSTTTSEPS